MEHLVIAFLVACLFSILISFGIGKDLTDSPVGRPILGAVGFLIPMTAYCWHRQDMTLFLEMTGVFILCLLPVLVAGLISNVLQDKRQREERRFVAEEIENDIRSRLVD